MPGVPREMRRMMVDQVCPRLRTTAADPDYRMATWYTQFTAESLLQEALNPVIASLPKNFELSFRTRVPENHVGLYGSAPTPESKTQFERACTEIGRILGDDVFSQDLTGQEPPSLERTVFSALKASNATLAIAESATGGLVSHRLTEIPGASQILTAAWIPYTASAKVQLLGVSPHTIETQGIVSEAVAREMARGALERMPKRVSPADPAGAPRARGILIAAALTGIAGPSTDRDPLTHADYPIGLAYSAIARSDRDTIDVRRISGRPSFSRSMLKQWFAQAVLDHLRRSLKT